MWAVACRGDLPLRLSHGRIASSCGFPNQVQGFMPRSARNLEGKQDIPTTTPKGTVSTPSLLHFSRWAESQGQWRLATVLAAAHRGLMDFLEDLANGRSDALEAG